MSDNDKCYQTINDWIAALQQTSAAIKAMPEALAPIVKAKCDESIRAGESLDGDKWAARKSDDAQALQGTEKDLTVKPVGNVILISIRNGLVFSQFGTKRQQRRSILPIKGLPFKLGNAIANGVVDMSLPFLERAGGHHKKTKGIRWSK